MSLVWKRPSTITIKGSVVSMVSLYFLSVHHSQTWDIARLLSSLIHFSIPVTNIILFILISLFLVLQYISHHKSYWKKLNLLLSSLWLFIVFFFAFFVYPRYNSKNFGCSRAWVAEREKGYKQLLTFESSTLSYVLIFQRQEKTKKN